MRYLWLHMIGRIAGEPVLTVYTWVMGWMMSVPMMFLSSSKLSRSGGVGVGAVGETSTTRKGMQ